MLSKPFDNVESFIAWVFYLFHSNFIYCLQVFFEKKKEIAFALDSAHVQNANIIIITDRHIVSTHSTVIIGATRGGHS